MRLPVLIDIEPILCGPIRFCAEHIPLLKDGSRTQASELYSAYTQWAKENGYRQMNHKYFVAELRRCLDVRRGGQVMW